MKIIVISLTIKHEIYVVQTSKYVYFNGLIKHGVPNSKKKKLSKSKKWYKYIF